MFLLAQFPAAGTIAYYAILIIIVAAIVGIVLVALRTSGVNIPPWAMTIFWIVCVALLAIFAIKFLLMMA